MKWTKKKFFINIFLLSLSCIFALILLEVLLRIYDPFPSRIRSGKIVLAMNKEYHYRNDDIRGLDRLIINRRNSLGFRGKDFPKDFANYLTIITVGGSTTECMYLTDGKTWPDLLGLKLTKSFNQVWLNNAGLDGHSTFGHLILMQDYLIKLRPKIVIFFVGLNDMGRQDLMKGYRFDQAGVDTSSPSPPWLNLLEKHSKIYNVIANWKRYRKAQELGLGHRGINLSKLNQIDSPDEQTQKNLKLLHKEYLIAYEMRLKNLLHLTKDNGIEPILLTQPVLYGDVIDEVTKVDLGRILVNRQDKINGKFMWEILECYNEVTRRVGQRESVIVIDLAQKMPKSSKYFYDFFHVNNEGAEKVAEIISQDLSPILAARFPQYLNLGNNR